MSEQLKEQLEKVVNDEAKRTDADVQSGVGNNQEKEQSGKIEDISKDFEKELKKNAEKEQKKEPLKLDAETVEDEETQTDILEHKSNSFIFIIIAVVVGVVGVAFMYLFNSKNDDEVSADEPIQEPKNGLEGF